MFEHPYAVCGGYDCHLEEIFEKQYEDASGHTKCATGGIVGGLDALCNQIVEDLSKAVHQEFPLDEATAKRVSGPEVEAPVRPNSSDFSHDLTPDGIGHFEIETS